MAEASLTISISGRRHAPPRERDALMLEQAGYRPYAGRVTRGQIIGYLRTLMYGYQEPDIDCGPDESGWINTTVLAYPFDPGLTYQLALSHGELGERTVEEIEFVELVNVRPGARDVSLKYPAQEVLAAEWVGVGLDSGGSPAQLPALTVDGPRLVVGGDVYGAIKVTYRVVVHGYPVRLPRREEAEENRWSSVAYARWDGGVKWLVLKLPDGVDEHDGDCRYGISWSGSVTYPDDPASDPQARKINRIIKVDYCSQEIISDVTYTY